MSDKYIVRDFMTTPATSLSQNACLLDALLTFRRTSFRHLPIVEGGRVVGIISERDVQRFSRSRLSNVSEEEYNNVFQNTLLKDVMTRRTGAVDLRIPGAGPLAHSVRPNQSGRHASAAGRSPLSGPHFTFSGLHLPISVAGKNCAQPESAGRSVSGGYRNRLAHQGTAGVHRGSRVRTGCSAPAVESLSARLHSPRSRWHPRRI